MYAGAGVGEVKHVSGGAGLYCVERTVTLAGVRVPDLVCSQTLRPLISIVTDTPESQSSLLIDTPDTPLLLFTDTPDTQS